MIKTIRTKRGIIMKKLFTAAVLALSVAASAAALPACSGADDTIYVNTNAFFAPFEYFGGDSGTEILGVDVDIMNLVGKKLGKKVEFTSTDFDVIIDNVCSGKQYDCGAAGITITAERAEKVAFSNPYFTSVQYVIYSGDTITQDGVSTDGKNAPYALWSQLAGKKIGYQRDTTGDIYVNLEINGEDGYTGQLQGAENTAGVGYDNAQLAVDAIGAKQLDVVVVDQLPANYIVKNNSSYKCLALYYDAQTATEEQYAICVNKNNTELLNAINEVLGELGTEGINALVSKHLGLN